MCLCEVHNERAGRSATSGSKVWLVQYGAGFAGRGYEEIDKRPWRTSGRRKARRASYIDGISERGGAIISDGDARRFGQRWQWCY